MDQVHNDGTTALTDTFRAMCRKCGTTDPEVTLGDYRYTTEVNIRCKACGAVACVYSKYIGDLEG